MTAPRSALLDVWLALGGESPAFEAWMAVPQRTEADAWAQLMAAVGGNVSGLVTDTNPPAGELTELVLRRHGLRW